MTKEYVEERYNLLFELYGVQSRGWSMLHEQFNRYVFCPDNRKSLIAEYLVWGDGTPKTIEQISYKEYAVIKLYLIKEGDYSPSIHN